MRFLLPVGGIIDIDDLLAMADENGIDWGTLMHLKEESVFSEAKGPERVGGMQTKSLIREARLLDEALHLNLRLSALYWEEMAELSLDRPKIEQIQRLQKRAYGRWQRRLRKFGREQ